VKQSAALN